jgi:putative hydrolase
MKTWEKHKDFLIWGDWHVHTKYTDGQNSVDEMCRQAIKNNLKLIAFTEHVRTDLDYDFDIFLKDINDARKKYPKLKILSGCEAKVLDTKGALDVSEDVIEKCDIVIASFHGFPFSRKRDHIEAMKNTILNKNVDIWGHPTQQLVRNGMKITQGEADDLIEFCKIKSVLIERNQSYPETHWFVDRALELGAPVVFSSDAHRTSDVRKLKKL